MSHNLILLESKGSVFEEDEVYTLFVENVAYKLKPLPALSTADKKEFALENYANDEDEIKTQVTFFPEQSYWRIGGNGNLTYFYGNDSNGNGAVINELSWENWRGMGSDENSLILRNTGWFLAFSETQYNKIEYKYKVVSNVVEGNHTCIANAFLENVRDRYTEIKLSYDTQSSFHNNPIYYLTNYTYTSETKEQTLLFKYKTGPSLLLKAIEQMSDYSGPNVVEFHYSEKENLMENMILPNKVQIDYKYEPIGAPTPIAFDTGSEVRSDSQLFYGAGFIINSWFSQNKQVEICMYNENMEQIHESATYRFQTIIGKLYEMVIGDSFFAIVVHTDYKTVTYAFGRLEDGKWQDEPYTKTYNQVSRVIGGSEYILVSTPDSGIELVEWWQEEREWRSSSQWLGKHFPNQYNSIACYKDKFVIYDDKNITMGYRSLGNRRKWQLGNLMHVPGFLSSTRDTLQKFNFKDDFEETLFLYFNSFALKISHNIVTLSKFVIDENKRLATKIKTFIIGRNHQVKIEKSFSVKHAEFKSIRDEHIIEGCKVILNYVYENEKIKLNLRLQPSECKTKKNQIITKINEMNSQKAQVCLLYAKDYVVTLHDQTIYIGKSAISFNGAKWNYLNKRNKRPTFPLSIPVGDKFVLSQNKSISTIKLYNNNGSFVADLMVKRMQNVQIHYPTYIAAQENNGEITVIEFIGESVRISTLPNSMNLTSFSNMNYLIASRNEISYIWPMEGIRRLLPNFVLKSQTINIHGTTSGARKRTTGFEYNAVFANLFRNGIQYSELDVLPGNNRTAYGYLRLKGESIEIYSGEDKLVKTLNRKKEDNIASEEEKEFKKKDSVLYDKTGRFVIADMSPFSIKSEMGGYIGFEDYEYKSKNWFFNDNNIVKDLFALSGRNYLKLESETIQGIFTPEFQSSSFLISSWIRTPIKNIPKLGDIAAYLRVRILSADGIEIIQFLSYVKSQVSDWSLLEVVVDLNYVGKLLETEGQSNSNSLKVQIEVSPSTDVPIDVDNVRFSQLDFIFEANVYNSEIEEPVAIITSNGPIIRDIYDQYRVKIGEVDDSNQIKKFHTYSKGSYLHLNPFKNPSCEIELIPENGFYEQFAPISFSKRWTVTDKNWFTSPLVLQHRNSAKSPLLVNTEGINILSFAIRFVYAFKGQSSLEIVDIVRFEGMGKEAWLLPNRQPQQLIPTDGEVLLVKEQNRVIVWIDGDLRLDQYVNSSSSIQFNVMGEVKLKDLILFSRPQIHITYRNVLNEVIQKVSLSSSNTAIIQAQLYDELGRQRITLQTVEVSRGEGEPLLAFAADLITNDDTNAFDSVWQTGRVEGEINKLVGHQFGFSEIQYDNSPLNVTVRLSLPGEKFATNGQFSEQIYSDNWIGFLSELYPRSKNTYRVSMKSSTVWHITVFNKNSQKVAWYVEADNSGGMCSTYEYNERGLLTTRLPPMYYSKVGIYGFFDNQLLRISSINREEHRLAMGTHISYDNRGNPLRKTSPDIGPQENLYDDDGRLRFVIQNSKNNQNFSVTYFDYDIFGRLSTTGNLEHEVPKAKLLEMNMLDLDSEAKEFQRFHYIDHESDPAFRGRLLRVATNYPNGPLFEEFIHDFDGNVLSKRYIIPTADDQPLILSVNQRYEGGLLKEISYPATMHREPFRVIYQYDRLGRIISVGVPGQQERFLKVTYNANDQVVNENFTPLQSNNFTRTYRYNEPGFPIQIEDPFLFEEISYTENGYGSTGYGDGTVTRTKFIAKWHGTANRDDIGVKLHHFRRQSNSTMNYELCFNELKNKRYLDENNQQTRVLYPELDMGLSSACTDSKTEKLVKEVLGRHGFPKEYGFSFDYGAYIELRKAKYFVGEFEPKAFQPESFASHTQGIDSETSKKIWLKLKSADYIGKDNKMNKEFMRTTLAADLKSVSPDLERFSPLFRKFLISKFAQRQTNVSLAALEDVMNQWSANKAVDTYNMLKREKYFQSPLEPDFVNILELYENHLNEIVAVLQKYSATELGEAEFDMESHKIDPNGNNLKFSAGFKNYEIKYETQTNRAKEIIIRNEAENQNEEKFQMLHDSRGNVVQAMHNGITEMEYHPVSNLLQSAYLKNGQTVTFSYDSKGERVFKRFSNAQGPICETHYIRDAEGRTLVERKLTFVEPKRQPDVLITMYIYGPKSLVGFVRRDQFYSVITDHQGSVRLVVRDGEVVAAYDYMPYGSLMRVYGSNPNAHINYRFTGQEWDPELGLYNYHARFYDPSIGRFYQIDPMSQYSSPYIYADNSPVSMVDPSGEIAFAIVLPVVFGLLGGYLGGAAVNDNWNPLEWDWSSVATYGGIGLGSVLGVTLAASWSASVLFFPFSYNFAKAAVVATVGLTSAYMSAAAVNRDIDFTSWDYSSPRTYNALFEGLSLGISSPFTVGYAAKYIQKLGVVGKSVFGVSSGILSTSFIALEGQLTNWDVKSPEFWYGAIVSLYSSINLSMILENGLKNILQRGLQFHRLLATDKAYLLKTINASFRKQPVFKSIIKLILISSGVGAVFYHLSNVGQWDLTTFTSYHKLILSVIVAGFLTKHKFISLHKSPSQISCRSCSESVTIFERKVSFHSIDSQTAAVYERVFFRDKPESGMLNSLKNMDQFIHKLNDDIGNIEAVLDSTELQLVNTDIKLALKLKKRRSVPANDNQSFFTSNHIGGTSFTIKYSNVTFVVDRPEILFMHTKNGIIYPRIKLKTQKMNKLNEQISKNGDPTIAQYISAFISNIPLLMKYATKFKFSKQNVFSWFHSDTKSQMLIKNEDINQTAIIIEKLFGTSSGLINRNQIAFKFKDLHLRNEQAELIRKKYLRKINPFSNEMDPVQKRTLEQEIKSLKIEEKVLLAEQIQQLVDFVWENLREYRDFLTKWDLVEYKGLEIDSPKFVNVANTNTYDSFLDLIFLSSKETADLLGYNCYNCISEALQMRSKYSDVEWFDIQNPDSPQNTFLRPVLNEKEIFRSIQIEENAVKDALLESPKRPKINRNKRNVLKTHTLSNGHQRGNEDFFNCRSNLLELGDNFVSNIVNNGTLLLTEVLLEKFNRRKLNKTSKSTSKMTLNYAQKQSFVCEVIEIYENALRTSANDCGISVLKLDLFNSFDLYENVSIIFDQNKFDLLNSLMEKFALEVVDRLQFNADQHRLFMKKFIEKLSEMDRMVATILTTNS